uniref:Uncharacterized protein n=1 Tax=Siphoviridae sp. ctxrg1 TaxID=2825741 RepID=A0A8S5Q3Q9_9CAUD|nr:MAG TPA: hypothetical protein [Siphoviridae sp. ctxrg1]
MEKTTKFSILSPEHDVKRLIFYALHGVTVLNK